MSITQLVDEAYSDHIKRKGKKPEHVRIGANTFRRLELCGGIQKTMDGYRLKGCRVVFSEHPNQLQFGDKQ